MYNDKNAAMMTRHQHPVARKYGLYLPCHENFKQAMRRYRGLLQKPSCPVGASLALRPAMAPLPAPPPQRSKTFL